MLSALSGGWARGGTPRLTGSLRVIFHPPRRALALPRGCLFPFLPPLRGGLRLPRSRT